MTQTLKGGQTASVLSLSLTGLSLGGTQILGPMELNVRAGETLALVGPSGIGKSSLLRIFAELETGFEGSCDVNGRSAIVFQEPALLPWRTLEQNICVTTGVSAAAATEALQEVGLADRARAFPNQLSLGQQRRLALARAFAVKPDLLFLDEPFVSLDAELAKEMMSLFKKLRAAHGVTTILVTHIHAEAEALATRIITLGGSPAIITSDA